MLLKNIVIGCLSNKGFHCCMKDDVVMGTLTVRENLMFSANLRLPESIKRRQKEERVQETIDELGLISCADSKVKLSLLVEV
jgi:ATP-binding cassette subfamily G (WHITE) protein 2